MCIEHGYEDSLLAVSVSTCVVAAALSRTFTVSPCMYVYIDYCGVFLIVSW